MKLIKIRAALETAWTVDNTWCDNPIKYFENDRSFFQCGNTAILIQELMGGSIMSGMIDGRLHYWNRINGIDVDLTARQFLPCKEVTDVMRVKASRLLNNPFFLVRYSHYRAKVKELLPAKIVKKLK